jgi:hypothetical protein
MPAMRRELMFVATQLNVLKMNYETQSSIAILRASREYCYYSMRVEQYCAADQHCIPSPLCSEADNSARPECAQLPSFAYTWKRSRMYKHSKYECGNEKIARRGPVLTLRIAFILQPERLCRVIVHRSLIAGTTCHAKRKSCMVYTY